MTAIDPDAFIRAHYHRDMSAAAIAATLKWTDARVRVRAKKLGLAKPGVKRGTRPHVEETVKRIRAMAKDGLNSREIAPRVKLSRGRVETLARDYGITLAVPRRGEARVGDILRLGGRSRSESHLEPVRSEPRAPRQRVERPPAISQERRQAQARIEMLAPMAPFRTELHCICGKAGSIHCDEHRALLQREGVL